MFYFGWPIQSGNGTESDIEMSHQMMGVLGSFARGEPAVPTGVVWPETQPGMNAMIIDGPNGNTCESIIVCIFLRLYFGSGLQKTTNASMGRSSVQVPFKLKNGSNSTTVNCISVQFFNFLEFKRLKNQ